MSIYRKLFVGGLSWETTESKLKGETIIYIYEKKFLEVRASS